VPSLRSDFIINDKYSSKLIKINSATDASTAKILNASGASDTLNSKLKATGAGSQVASAGLGKVAAASSRSAAAMKLAAQFQQQGLSKSEALSRAWDIVGRNANKSASSIGKFNSKLKATGVGAVSASNGAGILNNKLKATGVSASSASAGLSKYISLVAMLAAALKGINITDSYTSTSARLGLITNGQEEQLQLQDQIFNAAERARGSYGGMADAVAKMGLLAGDAFGSNYELVGFTELMQKSFKIGGSSQQEQSSGMYQLTQAMAAGKLQGDEFRSIMENAPMLANAIAKYTGKSKGELKKMSSEGTITADVIKNALFSAADDINDKFAKMPYTFADYWNRIKTEGTKAFKGLMNRISEIINSDKFKRFFELIVNGLYGIADMADKALDVMENIYDFISNNWQTIVDLVLAGAAAWAIYKAAMIGVGIVEWVQSMANPVSIAILLVMLLAAAYVLLWEKSEAFRKAFVTGWKSTVLITTLAYNQFARTANGFIAGWNLNITAISKFVKALKTGMVAGIKITSSAVLGMINVFSSLIDTIGIVIDGYNQFAKLTGKKTIDFSVNSEDLKSKVKAATGSAIGAINSTDESVDELKINKFLKLFDIDKVMKYADELGDKAENFTITGWIQDKIGEITNALSGAGSGDESDPTTIVGTGKGGSVKVNMDKEDIGYLRNLAEREFVNKFSTATLAPKISVKFTGAINKDVDTDAMYSRMSTILKEQIAVAAEGVY
jgi:tape measure domain-containing protein